MTTQIPQPDTEVPPADRARTIAHLTSTVLTALGHIDRHAVAAQDAGDRDSLEFNIRHVLRHVAEAVEHQRKTMAVLGAYFPAVRDELGSLTEITDPASTAPVDTDRSAAPSAVGFRCGACGGPRTPGGPCDDPECRESGDPGQRARDRAYKETTARYVASSVNGALDD